MRIKSIIFLIVLKLVEKCRFIFKNNAVQIQTKQSPLGFNIVNNLFSRRLQQRAHAAVLETARHTFGCHKHSDGRV